MSSCRYDAIVFDLDGTLIDSSNIKTWAFGKLYEPYGHDISNQVIEWHKKHEGISRFVKFRYWHEELLNELYTDALGDKLSESFSRLVIDAIIEAPYIDGAHRFLEQYYQDIPLFVASGTPDSELKEIILRKNMKKYFQGIYGSPLTKAEILSKIIVDNQWMPKRILMVGDALADWEGANITGTSFLGITTGNTSTLPKTELQLKNMDNLHDYVFSSVYEVDKV